MYRSGVMVPMNTALSSNGFEKVCGTPIGTTTTVGHHARVHLLDSRATRDGDRGRLELIGVCHIDDDSGSPRGGRSGACWRLRRSARTPGDGEQCKYADEG